jgi:hypothetical protein
LHTFGRRDESPKISVANERLIWQVPLGTLVLQMH